MEVNYEYEEKQQYRVTRYELNDKNELVKVDNPVTLRSLRKWRS